MTTEETIWVVGDLQGCHKALQALLSHPDIVSSPNPKFWFCGDLVNRGSDSKATLDILMSLGSQAVCILGNHDIHFLAVTAGLRKTGRKDTLGTLLNAPDLARYTNWLRQRPLLHYDYGHLMVHAGLLPQWTVTTALELAGEVEAALRSDRWTYYLEKMFGNKPNYWDPSLTGRKRLRVIINAMTRMRMCTPDGRLDFTHKNRPARHAQVGPWFEAPDRASADTPIIFGHWSALGLMLEKNAICLDTGCVWGRHLTAMRLHDRHLVQVSCAKDDPGNAAK